MVNLNYQMALLRLCLWSALMGPSLSYALECPAIPEQARSDIEVEVRTAVDKIGSAQGAELENRTRTITRDLVGKLPKADKVYLELMMYAAYCSTLRDDSTLTEAQKSAKIRAYNLELKKSLYPGEEAADKTKNSVNQAARAELERIPLPYTPDAFVDSAANGNLTAVKLFLAAGMDPNAKKAEGDYMNTALMYASSRGHIEIVKALLNAKANVNERNNRPGNHPGSTALSWAASAGRRNIVSILVNHGADTNSINQAFLAAAEEGYLEMLQALLANGVDKRVYSTALMRAAAAEGREMERNEVVRFLLKLGANVNAKSVTGWTPLLAASRAGNLVVLKTLLDSGAEINVKCGCGSGTFEADLYSGVPGWTLSTGWTPLMFAIGRDNEQAMVDVLLANGADPNLINDEGTTALILASSRANTNTIRMLLDKGADPNLANSDGETALIAAARSSGGSDTIRALLNRGAKPNSSDRHNIFEDDFTPLMWAAVFGYILNAEPLLESRANLHTKSKKGKTALMLAVQEGRLEMVQALLRKGAKVNDEDVNGKTVMNYAEEDLEGQERTAMLRVLKKFAQ